MASYVLKVDRDTIRFSYPHFQKDYSYGVNDVLSSSQRLLWQACTSHGCIKPWWLLISKLLNPQPEGWDALGLITIYPRPDEHWTKGRRRKYFPYSYYTIKAAGSQAYTWNFKYSGLPVHAMRKRVNRYCLAKNRTVLLHKYSFSTSLYKIHLFNTDDSYTIHKNVL